MVATNEREWTRRSEDFMAMTVGEGRSPSSEAVAPSIVTFPTFYGLDPHHRLEKGIRNTSTTYHWHHPSTVLAEVRWVLFATARRRIQEVWKARSRLQEVGRQENPRSLPSVLLIGHPTFFLPEYSRSVIGTPITSRYIQEATTSGSECKDISDKLREGKRSEIWKIQKSTNNLSLFFQHSGDHRDIHWDR